MSYNGKLVLDGEAADGDIEIYADGRNYPAYEIAVVPDNDLTEHERDTNARRIVACWNACEGVPTEVLEAYTVLEKLREQDTQRRELLAALEKAFPELDKIDRHCLGWPFVSEPVEILRAAIARAKGGAV